MAIFWAYENWRAHGHRVTVHSAECPYCNFGRGVRGGTRADNGKWHELGEFSEVGLALAMARSFFPAPRVRVCGLKACAASS